MVQSVGDGKKVAETLKKLPNLSGKNMQISKFIQFTYCTKNQKKILVVKGS